MPPAPPSPTSPARNKSVTFCSHCKHEDPNDSDVDVRYYSDPGRDVTKPKTKRKEDTDSERYYSEPDAKNYFEIDYEFLKELRKIAKNNCPKCKNARRRSRKDKERRTKKSDEYSRDRSRAKKSESSERRDRSSTKYKEKKKARSFRRENYVFCNGRYHSDQEHCRLCCRVCNRSTDTLDSIDDEYSLVSKSYSSSKATTSRSLSRTRERKNSIQSIKSVQSTKSVSFLETSTTEKDETNYTAKSFTNDLKKFLLKPATPRLSFRDKFMISFKQELENTKRSPKLKAIKGLWKSY